jgi:hypothetical protein
MEDAELDFVPGLRPKRMRWLILVASASIAIGAAYLTVSELNRDDPPRISVRQLRKRISTVIEAGNANVGRSNSNNPAIGASTSGGPTDP